MRIGVEATCWQNTRGYGRYTRSLLSALVRLDTENRYTFFLDSAENTASLPPGIETRVVRTRRPTTLAASATGRRSARDLWRMSRALSAPGFDLLLFPTVYSYVPVMSPARKIVTIHDVIAEQYPEMTVPRRVARFFWNTKVRLGVRQADAVVTVSAYSRLGILTHFEMDGERVFVVGEAADAIFRMLPEARPTPRLQSAGIAGEGRTIVYVGGFGPHKNLEALVDAFSRIAGHPELPDVRLVLVGECQKEVFHSHFRAIREQAARLGVGDRVVFTGFLPDEDLVVLLNRATVLALPSLMEGFGLPAIEAAACGCPVVATSESPLPALLGDGGIYVDPARPKNLEEALARVVRSVSLRARMAEAGLAASRRLSWDAAALQMLHVIHKVMAA